MIERLLAAERAVAAGELEQAERLYEQVAGADPRNAIALAGLAKVAFERADAAAATTFATRALAIDPEEVAAARILERVRAGRTSERPASRRGGLLGWLLRLLGR